VVNRAVTCVRANTRARTTSGQGCCSRTRGRDRHKHAWPGKSAEIRERSRKRSCVRLQRDRPRRSSGQRRVLPPILTLAKPRTSSARLITEVMALNKRETDKTPRDLGVDPRTVFSPPPEKESTSPRRGRDVATHGPDCTITPHGFTP